MKNKYVLVGIIILHIALFSMFIQVQASDSSNEKDDSDEFEIDDDEEFRIYDFDPEGDFYSVETEELYNPYFILSIGYRITLEGYDEEEGIHILLDITVQDETEIVAGIETRVVTEEEYEDGEIVETSYNYFALDEDANVIYFGEASYEYDDEGNPVLDEGSWRADDPGNLPGIIMPGEFEKGDKYYQEYAPEVAMDRAENIKHNKNFKTDLGKFKHCILIEETTPLEPDAEEIKIHAPGVGIIADEDLWITFYGYV